MTPEQSAIQMLLSRIPHTYRVQQALLFGSRARKTNDEDSDLDLALLMKNPGKSRVDVALELADIAFEVMLETNILIDPIPIWEEEWQHPETFRNPALLKNISRDGIKF